MLRKILYYQTFVPLDDILTTNPVITHIHLSSIHFGIDETDTPYIHLNNDSPYDEQFYHVWAQLEKAHSLGIKIVLMVGGAGGGYLSMSDDYETYYGLLKELIGNKPIISGIDLDVEEPVNMDMIQRLIRDIKTDMPRPLTVSMAPVQSALESDDPGLGGFSYKKLLATEEGKMIDYFNGQFYENYSVQDYKNAIKNGYNSQKVVMGFLWGQNYFQTAQTLSYEFKYLFGGIFVWEYSNINNVPIFLNTLKHL